MSDPAVGLLRGAPLRRYLAAAALARLADEMIQPTVVLLTLARNNNPVLAGILVCAFTVPLLCSGPVLGAWLDRTRYRSATLAGGQLMIAAAALGLTFAVGRAPAGIAIGLSVLGGLALPMTSGGFSALIPRLVTDFLPDGERGPSRESVLAKANALDATTFNLGAIAGPAIAATLGPSVGMLVIVVLASISAVAASRLPRTASGSRPADLPVSESGESELHSLAAERLRLGEQIRAGLRHILRTPALLGATATSVIGFGSVGALAVVFPLYAEELGAPRTAGGYFLTALEVGALVSTATVGRHLGRRGPERTVFACTALYGWRWRAGRRPRHSRSRWCSSRSPGCWQVLSCRHFSPCGNGIRRWNCRARCPRRRPVSRSARSPSAADSAACSPMCCPRTG